MQAAGYGAVVSGEEKQSSSHTPGDEKPRLPARESPTRETPVSEQSVSDDADLGAESQAQLDPLNGASVWLEFSPTYRLQEMQQLAHWLDIGASGIVVGAAGSGVSNLLRYFAHRPDVIAQYRQRNNQIVPIWLDLQPMIDPVSATVYRLVLRGILEQAAGVTGESEANQLPESLQQACHLQLQSTDTFALQTLLFQVLGHYRSLQIGFVFVFDRIDPLDAMVQLDVANNLRTLRDRFRDTVFYIMGMRLTPGYPSSIYALGDLGRLLLGQICTVGALTETDSYFTIQRRTAPTKRYPSEEEIDLLLTLSGGYPSLLKAVIEWWLTQQTPPPQRDWYATLLHQPGIQLWLREIWDSLPLMEQSAIATLIAAQKGHAQPSATISLAIEMGNRLTELGLCRRHAQEWQLRGWLLAGMVYNT